MKRFSRWISVAFHGTPVIAALAGADVFIPAPSTNTLVSAQSPDYGLHGPSAHPKLDDRTILNGQLGLAKRQEVNNTELPPEKVEQMLRDLQVLNAALAACSEEKTETGLLNTLFPLLGGALPPFSDLIESVRKIWIGDNSKLIQALAAAGFLGKSILVISSKVMLILLRSTCRDDHTDGHCWSCWIFRAY